MKPQVWHICLMTGFRYLNRLRRFTRSALRIGLAGCCHHTVALWARRSQLFRTAYSSTAYSRCMDWLHGPRERLLTGGRGSRSSSWYERTATRLIGKSRRWEGSAWELLSGQRPAEWSPRSVYPPRLFGFLQVVKRK